MTLSQFLHATLISGIGDIVRAGGHYHSFSLIAQGIELLGACLDEWPFHQKGKSEARFRMAIHQLFPEAYHSFNVKRNPFDLYSNLRCGLLHVVLPKNNLELIQRAELHRFPEGHLGFGHQRGNKRLILVSEDFYSDFEKACQEVIRKIEGGELGHEKLKKMQFLV